MSAEPAFAGIPRFLEGVGVELKILKVQIFVTFLLLLFLLLQINLDLHPLVLLCPPRLLLHRLLKVVVVQLVEGFLDQRAEVEEGHLPACQFERLAYAPEKNGWVFSTLTALLAAEVLSLLDEQDDVFQFYRQWLQLLQSMVLQHQFFAELREEPKHHFFMVPFYGVSLLQGRIDFLDVGQLDHFEVLPRILQLQIPGFPLSLGQLLLRVSLLLRLTPLQLLRIVLHKPLETHHFIADLLLQLLLILRQVILENLLAALFLLVEATLLHMIQLPKKEGNAITTSISTHGSMLQSSISSSAVDSDLQIPASPMNSKKQNNNKSTPRSACMIDCHFCIEPFEKSDISLARCCMKRCNKNYCIACIKGHFNPEFDMQMYRKDTWICYHCQGICVCDRCKRVEGSERKMARKKSGRAKAQGEEEVELSGSNLSQSNLRMELAGQLQPEDDLLLDFNEQDEESEQSMPEFKLYSEEEMVQFPPFYRKIAERRNKFYSFILKDCRKRRPIAKPRRETRSERKEMEVDKND